MATAALQGNVGFHVLDMWSDEAAFRQKTARTFSDGNPARRISSCQRLLEDRPGICKPIEGSSWNLQAHRRTFVFVDVPGNINSKLQGVGRTRRRAQEKTVSVFNVHLCHSADQRFSSKLSHKALR